MTAERYNEIIDYIIYIIKDELRVVFGKELKYYKSELYNEAGHNCLALQVYYDEEHDKFYLYYELDPLSRIYDCTQCSRRINGRLNANFQRDMNHKIEIVGPVVLSGPKSLPKVTDQSQIVLRNSTFSYWKCFDNTYRFLEDKQRLMNDHNIYYDANKIDEKIQKEKEFELRLFTINRKYNFNSSTNEADVKNAFEEYKDLYKELFGRELSPINSEDITYIFLNADYPDLSMFERSRINVV